jgi:nucleotide-binding universal stress UspA family protein
MKAILAATDFTPSSLTAVNYAANIAMATSTTLVLMHATHIPIVSDSFFDVTLTLGELEKSAKEQMEVLNKKLREKYGPELKLEKQVKIGFTTELIKELASKGHIEMVVLGIGHLDAFSQAVFGSTSTHLAGQINCPVLIIPDGKVFRPWKRLAFAFDQKPIHTGTGLRVIRHLAEAFHSQIDYVHVLDENYPQKDDSALKPVYKLFGETAPKLHYLHPVKGKTTDVLLDWARRYKSSALIMISREHDLLWRLLNERTTTKMAFQTNLPLLVVAEKKKHG